MYFCAVLNLSVQMARVKCNTLIALPGVYCLLICCFVQTVNIFTLQVMLILPCKGPMGLDITNVLSTCAGIIVALGFLYAEGKRSDHPKGHSSIQ